MAQGKDTSARPMRATRSGVSRKLLTRKALAQPLPEGEPLEASFPSVASDAADKPGGAHNSSASASALLAAPQPAAWSSEDEASFQTLLAQRKAAGYPEQVRRTVARQEVGHG